MFLNLLLNITNLLLWLLLLLIIEFLLSTFFKGESHISFRLMKYIGFLPPKQGKLRNHEASKVNC